MSQAFVFLVFNELNKFTYYHQLARQVDPGSISLSNHAEDFEKRHSQLPSLTFSTNEQFKKSRQVHLLRPWVRHLRRKGGED